LKTRIEAAYQDQEPRITGGPGGGRGRFDLIDSARPAQRNICGLMLRELLVERFVGVNLMRETKELPIYQLDVARSDRR